MNRYYGDQGDDILLYRPIPDGKTKVVLDANVLLDWALVDDSASWAALGLLFKQGFELYTSEQAKDEAYRTIAKLRVNKDPIDRLLAWRLERHVTVVNSASTYAGIADHDAHLASLASDIDALVLSEDLGFIHDADAAGIHARTVREILLANAYTAQAAFIPALLGTSLGPDGHILLKATAAEDMFRDGLELPLFANEFLGCVKYDVASASFRHYPRGQPMVSFPLEIEPHQPFCVLLEYSGGRKTRYKLRASVYGRAAQEPRTYYGPAFVEPPPAVVLWGNGYGEHQGRSWSGTLQTGTYGPYELGKKTWQACSKLIGVAPSALTADLTFLAATMCEVKGDAISRLPLPALLEMSHIFAPAFYPGKLRKERDNELIGDWVVSRISPEMQKP